MEGQEQGLTSLPERGTRTTRAGPDTGEGRRPVCRAVLSPGDNSTGAAGGCDDLGWLHTPRGSGSCSGAQHGDI